MDEKHGGKAHGDPRYNELHAALAGVIEPGVDTPWPALIEAVRTIAAYWREPAHAAAGEGPLAAYTIVERSGKKFWVRIGDAVRAPGGGIHIRLDAPEHIVLPPRRAP